MKQRTLEWILTGAMSAIAVLIAATSCVGPLQAKAFGKLIETTREGASADSAPGSPSIETISAYSGGEIAVLLGGMVSTGMVAGVGAMLRRRWLAAIDRLIHNIEIGKSNDFPARVVAKRIASYGDDRVEALIWKRVRAVTKGECNETAKRDQSGPGGSAGSVGVPETT